MLITVLIPTLNRPSLAMALKSLTLLPNGSWQALVIGDGVDPTIDKELEAHTTILTLPKVSGFQPAAAVRNAGIDFALASMEPTPFYGFLDDDDILLPSYVNVLKTYEKDADAVLFRMNYFRKGLLPPARKRNFLKRGWVGISFAVRREALQEGCRFRRIKSEDYHFLYDMRAKDKTVVVSKEAVYIVRPLTGGRKVPFTMPPELIEMALKLEAPHT